MKITQTLPQSQWRHFVDHHPHGNIFHTPEMFQVFAQSKGYTPSVWAALDEEGEVVSLFTPVEVTLMPGLARYLTTRSIAYGGILYQPTPVGEEGVALLLQTYTRCADKTFLFTELRNLSDVTDIQPLLLQCGFAYEEHLNYLVDLHRPPEAILQGMGRRTRKQIRRGLKQGQVIIEEAHSLEQVAIGYRLLQKSYANAHVPLPDISLFEATFSILFPKNRVKFLLARIGEEYVASSVELLYKDTIYGWYGGVDRSYSRYLPNELLLWHIFQWGAEHGFKTYDFGGAGSPHKPYGVRDFKAKFGGKLVCYGRNTCIHAPIRLALSKIGYRLLVRFL
ncbi:MAG: GNAT family N-acetyltransferase [Caldilineae bacterium]|nr:MAG: GNAT family N-acetyltransferase [Caldilineae bacterium]